MMTSNRPARDPYPLLLAALTWHERQVLYASLNSGWHKQAAVYHRDSPETSVIWRETGQILSDINHADENAAAYREHATATCRNCGISGAAAELEKITAHAIGDNSTRTEWLCADHAACTARRFPQLADTLAALPADHAPSGGTR